MKKSSDQKYDDQSGRLHIYETYSSRNNTNTSNTDAHFSSVVKQTFVMACISSLKWSVEG